MLNDSSAVDQPLIAKTDYRFLKKKQDTYEKQLAACRVFIFRSQELITTLGERRVDITKSRIFQRTAPIWQAFYTTVAQSLKEINKQKIYDLRGIKHLNKISLPLLILAILLITTLALIFIRASKKWLHDNHSNHHLLFPLITTSEYFILPILILTTLYLFLSAAFYNISPSPTILLLNASLLIYLFSIALLRFLFWPPNAVRNPLRLPHKFGKSLFYSLFYITSLIFIWNIYTDVLREQQLVLQANDLVRTLMITALSIAVVWFSWLLTELSIIRARGEFVETILKWIVNNFVSGLILLIEKPIKHGDRIRVGDTEGFVRKIRMRATRITTREREDVIVPNSQLITNEVTNFMYHNKFWRVKCFVTVAYGTDLSLARELLLDIVNSHPEVNQESKNKPTVLFRAFGKNGLALEIRVIITNVNDKARIRSEINFSIYQEFKKHNIEIPYPQLDVHHKTGKK